MKTWLIISLFAIGAIVSWFVIYDAQLRPSNYTLEIQGMKEMYYAGEEYSFYYTLSGYGNTCHSWTVFYPDENSEVKIAGEAIDCTEPTNKELSYDSRKDSRKFASQVPKLEGTYNVTVSLENIEPAVFEFSVIPKPQPEITSRYEKYLDENNELTFNLRYDKNGIIIDDLQRILDWCDYSGEKPKGWYFEWNNQTHHINSDDCKWVEHEN